MVCLEVGRRGSRCEAHAGVKDVDKGNVWRSCQVPVDQTDKCRHGGRLVQMQVGGAAGPFCRPFGRFGYLVPGIVASAGHRCMKAYLVANSL